MKKYKSIFLFIASFALVLFVAYVARGKYITFSDSAKYALVAKSIVETGKYGSTFSFYNPTNFIDKTLYITPGILPLTPYSMAVVFKIFGIGDTSVFLTSLIYFGLSLVFVFLLSKRVFKSNLVGYLSVLAVGMDENIIRYAVGGASESPFIFEIVASCYFATLRKRWANILMVLTLILMYFTRPQAFIYITGVILYSLILNFKPREASSKFVLVLFGGLLLDYFVLKPLTGKYWLYSILVSGTGFSFNQTSVASTVLRGEASLSVGLIGLFKNIFYNLYNFYKLAPQILSPYLLAIYIIGVFIPSDDKTIKAFRTSSLFMVTVTLLVVAATIPFFRYIHPIIPLVYIMAVGVLVKLMMGLRVKASYLNVICLLLMLVFGISQTLGVVLLDSRFERNNKNVGKPPTYANLSYILKENTNPEQIIVSNLDTWGSWYGERRTIWFPVEPKQLIGLDTNNIPFDAIYLTSYLIDDPNYYMGKGWRTIFENPYNSEKWTCDGCEEVRKEFAIKGVYQIPAESNYDNFGSTAILLVKK